MKDDMDYIDAEGEEVGSVAGLATVPISDALVRPAASVSAIEESFHEYQQLCTRLLTDDDIQHIGGKSFRKKSAWRKLAVAFGVSCEVRERIYDRDDTGAILRAEVIVRATAPNGRYMDGLGVCDVSERKFSKPQHDIPATAMTRATNRACADLFGMGEVSAEEITDEVPQQVTRRGPQNRPAPMPEPAALEEWRTLGYTTHGEYTSRMEALIQSVRCLDENLRDEYKLRRKQSGIGWPVPAKQMNAAVAIVASLAPAVPADNEPF